MHYNKNKKRSKDKQKYTKNKPLLTRYIKTQPTTYIYGIGNEIKKGDGNMETVTLILATMTYIVCKLIEEKEESKKN